MYSVYMGLIFVNIQSLEPSTVPWNIQEHLWRLLGNERINFDMSVSYQDFVTPLSIEIAPNQSIVSRVTCTCEVWVIKKL